MKKKLLIIVLGLVGSFSVFFTNEEIIHSLNASIMSANTAGGVITGRVNLAPDNLAGNKTSIGFKSGDKIAVQAGNNDNAWQLDTATTIDTYNCKVTLHQPNQPEVCKNTPIHAWASLMIKPIAQNVKLTTQTDTTISPWIRITETSIYYGYNTSKDYYNSAYVPYHETLPAKKVEELNTELSKTTDKHLLTYYNEKYFFDYVNSNQHQNNKIAQTLTNLTPSKFGKKAYIYGISEQIVFTTSQKKFASRYWMSYNRRIPEDNIAGWGNELTVTEANGIMSFIRSEAKPEIAGDYINTTDWFNEKADVRPAANLDLNNVVFAISKGTTSDSGLTAITSIPNDFAKTATDYLKDAEPYDNMIARIYDSNMSITVQDDPFYLEAKDQALAKVKEVQTITKGHNIRIKANGSIGGTISAVIFDTEGEPLYYTTLGASTGTDTFYELDSTNLNVGSYQIAIVNEVLPADGSASPVYSSKFSSAYMLSVVDPITIEVNAKTDLEHSINVKANDVIAGISSSGGVAPITYSIESESSVSGHTDDFKKFDITGNDIFIKDANGLEAGDYYFKVNGVDANGHPIDGVPSQTVHITVAKTNPDLKFNSNTVDLIVDGQAVKEVFSHKNSDFTDSDFQLTFSSNMKDIADVDKANGNNDTDVWITPGSINGSATIKIELAETKNFAAAEATLIVHVHPKISLSFTSDKNSFAVSDVATNGTKIGSVSLTGNSPKYTYSMAVDPNHPNDGTDNASFNVRTTTMTNDTSMDILTNTPNIPQGTYKITIKAEDAYGQVVYASGTITVSGIAQTGFDFYDYRDTSNKITDGTLTIYYGETGAKLIAKGGQSSGLTYAPDDPTQTILTIDPTNGTLVTNDIGKVKVKATKPADGTYSEAVIYMYVEVKPCEQEIVFDKTGTTTISYDNTNGYSFSETATGKIKMGMPNAGNESVGTIEYTLGGTDKDIASIDSLGNITINAGQNIATMKTFTVTAKLNDGDSKNEKYGSASVTKTINVYPPGSASWNQTNKPQADNNTGMEKVGDLIVTGGSGNASYSISKSGDADNLDKEFFYIYPTSGEVTLIKTITVSDITSKTYNTTEEAYEMKVMVDITDGGNTTTEHLTIYIKGAVRTNLDFKNKDSITQEITETYDINKDFNLSLNQNITSTTYRISTNPAHSSPSDVITVSANGKTDIQNANEVSISGSTTAPVYVEAVVPPSNGYMEVVIEAPVRIKRAAQALTFSQDPINTSADIQSLNITMSGHKDTNNLVYSSSDSKVRTIADPTNSDTFTIKPNGIVKNGITITAIAQGDRNYKDTMKTATLNIAQAGTNQFTAIFPSMTYGENGAFKVTIAPAGSGSETYTYVVRDTDIVEIDANGNITPHHAGTTTVDVTKTSTGGSVGPYTFTITVDPKPITITIEDKEKYTGMAMPVFTANIPRSDIIQGDDIPKPDFSCVDNNGIDVDANTVAGVYPITGNYVNPPSDYDITIVDGELTVKQDSASNSWYELQDASGNKTSNTVWHKDSVDIVLKSATASAGTYDQIAKDISFSNQDLTRFTVSEEGETTQDIYFRIDLDGSDPHKGAVSLPIQDTVRIDKTDPIIKSITGKNASNSKVRQFLNAVTFGQFFKQGTIITIEAEDVSPSQGVAVSGIQKTSYEIKKLDEDGKAEGTPNTIEQNDDTIEISIKEAGTYEVCATATDQAGRESTEKCETFDIRKIDTDVDKDGKPDFNDPNEDGCADFNIVYKDKDGNWVTLNEDKDRDGIPEMNIDSDGDGEPDINVDTDGDGKPDLNLVHMTKELWKPTQCVTQHGEQYESGMDITPQINVDLDILHPDSDSYHVPDINIDTDGDMKSDLNITKESSTTPYLNILPMKLWTPKNDHTVQGFTYDTMDWMIPLTNYDSDHDGYPDLNIDFNLDGLPDINIDFNYDGLPDLNVDTDGDGIPNFNLDVDENGKPTKNIYPFTEWKPEKNGARDQVMFDTMEIAGKSELEDQGIVIEKPDGDFLPNYAIKVQEVTESKKEEVKKQASDLIDDQQEVKAVYDVKLLENDVEVQPDGTIKVKIPIPNGIKNPKIVLKNKNGIYEEMKVKVENGYFVYETNALGIVSVIGDKDEGIATDPDADVIQKDPTDKEITTDTAKTSVKGSYTSIGANMGGAFTGDRNNILLYIVLSITSFSLLLASFYYKKKRELD